MSADHPVRRVLRVFPATSWAVILTLMLLVTISFETERDRPGPFDWASALTFIEPSALGPIVFLFLIAILVGLLVGRLPDLEPGRGVGRGRPDVGDGLRAPCHPALPRSRLGAAPGRRGLQAVRSAPEWPAGGRVAHDRPGPRRGEGPHDALTGGVGGEDLLRVARSAPAPILGKADLYGLPPESS